MTELSDSEILDAWHINAKPWIKAIENEEIESRKLVTNQAIIDAVQNISPREILDIGCGEGWLVAKLINKNTNIFGIDAVPALIEKARSIKGAQFDICTYENLDNYQFKKKFDCLICNFSLIGKESTVNVIKTTPKLLNANGTLLIQTLHPLIACGDVAYKDGWRQGSWAGFSNDFTKPAPWYFRTIQSWCKLLSNNGLQIKNIHEPLNPKTGKPASIIFEAKA